MARRRMVTRTVATVETMVMCVDVTTATVDTQQYNLVGKYDTIEDLEKALKKTYETESFKLVKVISYEDKEVLYGMDESEFIRLASILPPRTKTDTESEE